jgi:hypothetical protein
MDLHRVGLLASRGLRDRTSYQRGDGRDPAGWEDAFDVHLGLPMRAAGGRPTGVCPTRQQPQPDHRQIQVLRTYQVIGAMSQGRYPLLLSEEPAEAHTTTA